MGDSTPPTRSCERLSRRPRARMRCSLTTCLAAAAIAAGQGGACPRCAACRCGYRADPCALPSLRFGARGGRRRNSGSRALAGKGHPASVPGEFFTQAMGQSPCERPRSRGQHSSLAVTRRRIGPLSEFPPPPLACGEMHKRAALVALMDFAVSRRRSVARARVLGQPGFYGGGRGRWHGRRRGRAVEALSIIGILIGRSMTDRRPRQGPRLLRGFVRRRGPPPLPPSAIAEIEAYILHRQHADSICSRRGGVASIGHSMPGAGAREA